MGLDKALESHGIKNIKTRVGDRFVYEEIKRQGFSLGGEQSGHIIFPAYSTTGDGLLTSLKIMEIMLSKKARLSELTADFRVYPQVLINVPVSDKEKAMGSTFVKSALEEAEKSLGKSGRVLLRASGTENVIRVMVEAVSEEKCRSVAEVLAESVRNCV
jgi:phosphoglucosamine mutase